MTRREAALDDRAGRESESRTVNVEIGDGFDRSPLGAVADLASRDRGDPPTSVRVYGSRNDLRLLNPNAFILFVECLGEWTSHDPRNG